MALIRDTSETKTFGGETYHYLYFRYNKITAQHDAQKEKANGKKVRITTHKTGNRTQYELWAR